MNEWFAVLSVLQVGDILTTMYAFHRGGIEVNPLLARLFKRHDPMWVLVGAKLAFLVFVAVLMKIGLLPLWVIQALCAGYAALLAWNGYQIAKMRK